MTRTILSEHLAARGARFGEYGGAETPAGFDDPAAEFAALRAGCGVYDLGWRAKLAITGEDRVRWMNGMVTNNVRDLLPNHGNYNFLLNAQGHILGDLYVYNHGDYLLVDTDAAQAPRLREVFEKYIIMDDVEVTDISEKLTAIGLAGPAAPLVMRKWGVEADSMQSGELRDVVWQGLGISVVRTGDLERRSFEIWLAPAHAAAVWDALVAAGATPVGTEALESWRVLWCVPRYGQDIRERDLPQETEQNHALNFTKGCYVGQEIVERIRSRGQVHRRFGSFKLAAPVTPGARIQKDGKEIGEVTSVASLPEGVPGIENGSRFMALGYIRREAARPGAAVQVGETTATVNLFVADI